MASTSGFVAARRRMEIDEILQNLSDSDSESGEESDEWDDDGVDAYQNEETVDDTGNEHHEVRPGYVQLSDYENIVISEVTTAADEEVGWIKDAPNPPVPPKGEHYFSYN
jgi:hypothetical protein